MRALLRQSRFIALVGLVCGCPDPTGRPGDGGVQRDAGDAGDAGSAVDAGLYAGEGMVVIPAGPFFKGCNPTSCLAEVPDCCLPHELPQHEVVTSSYAIDRTETSVATYRACVNAGQCPRPSASDARCNFDHPDRESHPINCLEPAGARAVCAFQGKRLCTESEWEKAASGGCELYGSALCALSIPPYVHGARSLASDCGFLNHDERYGPGTGSGCGLDRTWAVASWPLGRSPYGVLDLNGNAAEFTEDCFAPSYEATPRDGSAHRARDCAAGEAVRGGSFVSLVQACKTWVRRPWSVAREEATCCGVRCCRDP